MAKNRQNQSKGRRFIDVHHHIIPPDYVSALKGIGITGAVGTDFPKWSPEKSLRLMDKKGIAVAITSVSTPGVYHKNDSFSRDLARRCNEYSAQLMTDYPDRFGSLAILPLPDAEGAWRELEYALDTLKLDGVILLSSVDGHYIGAADNEDLFAELNRRKTVVFIHPHDLPGDKGDYALLDPIFERLVDTTRTVTYLLRSGILERYPDIRYILSHGGGSVPFMAQRIAVGRTQETSPSALDQGLWDYSSKPELINRTLDLLRTQFYYDMAQQGPPLIKAVQELADPAHIVFGTDAPWQSDIQVNLLVKALDEYDGFDDAARAAMERQSALELFPRFKDVSSR